MKTKQNDVSALATISERCAASCKQLLAGIQSVRNRVTNEFHDTYEAHERLVRLALNEAEALAWETAYPHLLFPALAAEKLQAVATWQTRQRAIRRNHPVFAEAA